MALQNSGAISASDINQELDRESGTPFSLGGGAERDLAGVTSGQISLADFYGASAEFFSGTVTSGAFQYTDAWGYSDGSDGTSITGSITPSGASGEFTTTDVNGDTTVCYVTAAYSNEIDIFGVTYNMYLKVHSSTGSTPVITDYVVDGIVFKIANATVTENDPIEFYWDNVDELYYKPDGSTHSVVLR